MRTDNTGLLTKYARLSTKSFTQKTIESTFAGVNSDGLEAARQAVFNTAELLENILVHLPLKSILVSQRVNTRFRDTVVESTQIQRKLFCIVDEPRRTWRIVGNDFDKLRFESVKAGSSYPAPYDWDPKMLPYGTLGMGSSKDVTPARLNPLLEKGFGPPLNKMSYSPLDETRAVHQMLIWAGIKCHLDDNRLGTCAGASWRKMHLSDPPCTRIKASVILEIPKGSSRRPFVSFELTEESGITLGALFDRALQMPLPAKNG